MEYLTYDGIEQEIDRLAGLVSAPPCLLPTYRTSEDFARPHIEIDGDFMYYVVVERGQEVRRDFTNDRDALLYWVFSDVTHEMATTFEVAHRIEGEDFRKLLFSHQAGLLKLLRLDWVERWIDEKRHLLDEVGLEASDILL